MIKKTILNYLRKLDDVVHSFGSPRVLFVIRNGLGMSCMLPIIEGMESKREFKIGITLEIPNCYLASGSALETFKKYFIPTEKATNKKWHVVLTTDWTDLWFTRNTTIVYTQHGNGYGNLDKKPLTSSNLGYIENLVLNGVHDIYLANAEGEANEMKKWIKQLPEPSAKQCIVTGMPKIDRLLNSTKEQGLDFLTSLALNPKSKTIVVSSHWTEKSLFRTLGVSFVGQICALYPEFNILVMGHGNLWRNHKGKLFCEMKKIEQEYDKCRFLPNLESTVGLLRAGDLFVGDNSTFLIEYCMMAKQILFFDNPELTFDDMYVWQLYKSASLPFSTEDELVQVIQTALELPDNLNKNRSALVGHFQENLGHAVEAVIDTVEQLALKHR